MNRRHFLSAAALAAPLLAQPGAPRIKIGQIGTKHPHAAGKLQTILKHPELYEFVGLAESDPARREAMKNRAPYKGLPWMDEAELLAHPGLQAIAVETDVFDLVPTARRCIAAGLHIHLDKPAGESLADCKLLHAEATAAKRVIQMGYMLRYNPAFEFLFQAVRDGWLGEITEVSGMMGKKMNDAGRQDLARFQGGGMFELACHLIDALVTVLGAPRSVIAFTHRSQPDKDTFADNQLAVFDYPNAIATIRCNHIDPLGGPRRSFSVTGTEGTIEINPLEPGALRLGLEKARDGFPKGFQDVPLARSVGRYDAEFIDLAKVIRGEKALEWDASHDVATHEAVLRASGVLS